MSFSDEAHLQVFICLDFVSDVTAVIHPLILGVTLVSARSSIDGMYNLLERRVLSYQLATVSGLNLSS